MEDLHLQWVVVLQTILDLIAKAIITFSPIILPMIATWGVDKWQKIRATQPAHIQDLMDKGAKFAYQYAEQEWKTGRIEANKRKDEALNAFNEWLDAQGIVLDDSLLNKAIESYVLGINQQKAEKTKDSKNTELVKVELQTQKETTTI